jgi:hypothetical protein
LLKSLSLRFSLRALLLAVLLFGVLAGFAARVYHRGERQRQILIAARAAGGRAEYDFDHYKQSRWYAPARWLAPRIGADQVGNIVDLNFQTTDISQWRPVVAKAAELQAIERFRACSMDLNSQDLEHLVKFKQLKELEFSHVSELPNLQPLAQLPHLERLRIRGQGITVANLAALQAAPRLRMLGISNTDATDEIIPLLATFPHLEELDVHDTDITPKALAGLKNSPSLRILHVDLLQQEAKYLLPRFRIIVD